MPIDPVLLPDPRPGNSTGSTYVPGRCLIMSTGVGSYLVENIKKAAAVEATTAAF